MLFFLGMTSNVNPISAVSDKEKTYNDGGGKCEAIGGEDDSAPVVEVGELEVGDLEAVKATYQVEMLARAS